MEIYSITYNPFQENTYLIVKDDRAVVVDPGMSNVQEREHFEQILKSHGVTLDAIWLTHAHIDHVLGCEWVARHYDLEIAIFPEDLKTLDMAEMSAKMYGIPYDPCPVPTIMIEEGEFDWNDESFEVRWIPGHAPGHVVFIHHASKQVVGGDVLFRESIGRTDLPGGNHELLLSSISSKLYNLSDDYEVFPGHGPSTTIGYEKQNNPFVRG